jgi:hypothetical protein
MFGRGEILFVHVLGMCFIVNSFAVYLAFVRGNGGSPG